MINKKQILVIALVLVIITAGVLQYTYGKSGFSARKDDDERLGEAVYVDNVNGSTAGTDNDIAADSGNVPVVGEADNFSCRQGLTGKRSAAVRKRNFRRLQHLKMLRRQCCKSA